MPTDIPLTYNFLDRVLHSSHRLIDLPFCPILLTAALVVLICNEKSDKIIIRPTVPFIGYFDEKPVFRGSAIGRQAIKHVF